MVQFSEMESRQTHLKDGKENKTSAKTVVTAEQHHPQPEKTVGSVKSKSRRTDKPAEKVKVKHEPRMTVCHLVKFSYRKSESITNGIY